MRATIRIVPKASRMATTCTINAGMTRLDAHWAPLESDDMTLLSTWTPLGAANEGCPGRANARSGMTQGAGGTRSERGAWGVGDRSVSGDAAANGRRGDSLLGSLSQTWQRCDRTHHGHHAHVPFDWCIGAPPIGQSLCSSRKPRTASATC